MPKLLLTFDFSPVSTHTRELARAQRRGFSLRIGARLRMLPCPPVLEVAA